MYQFSKLDEEDNAKIEKLYGILKSYIYINHAENFQKFISFKTCLK